MLSFSPHLTKYKCCQHDLSLMILVLITVYSILSSTFTKTALNIFLNFKTFMIHCYSSFLKLKSFSTAVLFMCDSMGKSRNNLMFPILHKDQSLLSLLVVIITSLYLLLTWLLALKVNKKQSVSTLADQRSF